LLNHLKEQKDMKLKGGIYHRIDEDLKLFYYRGLQEWTQIKEYLLNTCLTAQDNYKAILQYFEIEFE